ncbi:hypothetical protein [Pseudomonas syringae]|uniref:hypothetical protein n=1 Tax=Pseudomonas syringae TaxID=317 RepID=UPI0006895AEC|nr:hypothetical protein [Pseudomonas syringae]
MSLRTLVLPTGVRAEVLKLLAGIEVAESAQAVNMAGHRAEGFVLGLETACALKADVIEALYIGFESVTQLRHYDLRQVSGFTT